MWFETQDFLGKLKSWWESFEITGRPSSLFWKKLNLLTDKIQTWKYEEFGRLNTKIQDSLSTITELDSLEENQDLSS
ncbi:hypothetical protein BVC80_4229g1 [Macleaya cordata]|uniref:Uncharacterized protein n=1 Tax=Macleaya cordata TaxID=56857 RepID=A0A200QM78_MACCD|nr:hypothetical protein BVC80_4229g1 [Macleaya cordata]